MEIVPNVGIGMVRLGMSREEADWLRVSGMQLDSAGNPPVVTFIQVSRSVYVTYRGVDLLEDPADEVVAAIVQLEGLDAADYPPGEHRYLFPNLSLLLWRGEVSDEPGEQGHTFQAASVQVPSYLQRH